MSFQVYGSLALGSFGTLNCDCLKGFEPKLSKDWDVLDWSGGCVRKDPHKCQEREGFLKFTELKLHDSSQFRRFKMSDNHHRDFKASNVLLDNDMNPKISNSGMARMFGEDRTEANTKRIVGT
ncbi:hypothetical protein DITRI_Ditri19aG0122000 [Diplodiscus trichospermus]